MTTTTIRTTCSSCSLTLDVPTANVVVALPATTASGSASPSLLHLCPGCLTCNDVVLPWPAAAYLLHLGATSITTPTLERITPHYPERRPSTTTPMTLDDLIDLHVALDADTPPL